MNPDFYARGPLRGDTAYPSRELTASVFRAIHTVGLHAVIRAVRASWSTVCGAALGLPARRSNLQLLEADMVKQGWHLRPEPVPPLDGIGLPPSVLAAAASIGIPFMGGTAVAQEAVTYYGN